MEPHVGDFFMDEAPDGEEEVVKDIKPKVTSTLPLDDAEIAPIHEGLRDVISGAEGTAAGAFAGFPTGRFPIYGKTGTAQIGSVTSGLNYAWFVSYSEDPRYVVSVYLEKAGHGGESAAPVARQIWEGIFGIDKTTDVNLSSDASG
jgi:penicillin-binding protein 2